MIQFFTHIIISRTYNTARNMRKYVLREKFLRLQYPLPHKPPYFLLLPLFFYIIFPSIIPAYIFSFSCYFSISSSPHPHIFPSFSYYFSIASSPHVCLYFLSSAIFLYILFHTSLPIFFFLCYFSIVFSPHVRIFSSFSSFFSVSSSPHPHIFPPFSCYFSMSSSPHVCLFSFFYCHISVYPVLH